MAKELVQAKISKIQALIERSENEVHEVMDLAMAKARTSRITPEVAACVIQTLVEREVPEDVINVVKQALDAPRPSLKELNGYARTVQAGMLHKARAKEFLGLTTRSKDGAKGITMNVEKLQVLNLKDLTEEEQEAALLESLE